MVAPQLAATAILGGAVAAMQLPVLPSHRQLAGFWAIVALCLLSTWLSSTREYLPRRKWREKREAWPPRRQAGGAGHRIRWLLLLTLGGASVAIVPAERWQQRLLPAPCERERVQLSGEVTSLVSLLGAGQRRVYRFDLRVDSLQPERCAGPRRVRLYLPVADAGPIEGTAGTAAHANAGAGRNPGVRSKRVAAVRVPVIQPGEVFSLSARLRRPRGLVNPHALQGEKQFLIAGIHAVGSVAPDTLRSMVAAPSLMSRVQRLRDRLSVYLRGVVSGDSGVLLAALAVGDRRSMRPEMWDRLRIFGITHLLVISGMHVALVALPGWFVGSFVARSLMLLPWRCAIATWIPAVFALLPALAYSLLAGLALPTQRALLMLCLGLLPGIFGRPSDSGRLLALSAIGLLLLDPVSVLGASFWLTLGAVALLLWFALWRGARGGLIGAASAQAFMLVSMLPMGLMWFHSASTLGGVVNLVAIPLVTLLIVPALLLALLLAACLPAGAELLLRLDGRLLALLWDAMGYWETSMRSLGTVERVPDGFLVMVALAGVLLLPLPRFAHRMLILPLLLAPLLFAQRTHRFEDLSVLFADVGQGTAVLARLSGESLLYDTGGGAPGAPPVALRSVLPVLRGEGVTQLDHLVISHPDRDHDAGEELIAAAIPVRSLRRGGPRSTGPTACRPGERQRFGKTGVVQFLSLGLANDSDNNASCVLMLEAHGRRVLLPGDIDTRRERELLSYWGAELAADVLMLAHHGSGGSSSRLWLRSVSPRLSVVSAGHANRFGHPAGRVLETVAAEGSQLLNTAEHGAIELRIAPDGSLHGRCYRHRGAPFWRRGRANRRCVTF